jgi:flavodoxin I
MFNAGNKFSGGGAGMKTLIVYDSQYGFTQKIADAIGGGIGGEVKSVKVGDANSVELRSYDLLIFGSPTQGGRQTVAMKAFLGSIPADELKNKSVAAFDTRMKSMLVKLFGWAADRIADALKEKSAVLLAPPEGFFVKTGKGPLVDGELERAAAWGKSLAAGKK